MSCASRATSCWAGLRPASRLARPPAIERMRAHPLARAVRIDKLSLAALEATLRLHRDPVGAAAQIPVLEMLAAGEHDLLERARRIHDGIAADAPAGSTVRIVRASGRAGGGSLPLLELEGPVVAVEGRGGAAGPVRTAAPGRPCDRRAGTRGRGAARPAHAVRRRGRVRRARSAGRAARCGMTDPALTLGTAGHIDHGKTSLVRALTGVDTDRLPEERERGISIELGFARMELPSGRWLSVVDVPGHERFVRTMVAGATGIDLFLLVVAADDGVMPQTREHVAVLEQLEVPGGVVALTKADLAGRGGARARAGRGGGAAGRGPVRGRAGGERQRGARHGPRRAARAARDRCAEPLRSEPASAVRRGCTSTAASRCRASAPS